MRILLDNPNGFFKKYRETFWESFAYMATVVGIFAVLNEMSIRAGLTNYVPKAGIAESLLVNFMGLVGGFFLLALIFSSVALKKYGFRRGFIKSFFLLSYASTPVFMLGWVPFAVVKAIGLLWALFFVMIGIKMKLGYDYRKSFFLTMFVIAIVYALILVSRNEILSVVPIYN